MVQCHNQQESIDYDETFASVARLEAIRILIAFVDHMNMKLFQMNVKITFLNCYLKEVYVQQQPSSVDQLFSYFVFKLDKALYDFKQAPRAWYKRLSIFLMENQHKRGTIDKILFIN